MAPEPAHVFGDPGQVLAYQQMLHGSNSGAADLVAAPDGKGKPVAFQPGAIRMQNGISGRVVRVRIHGVRAVQIRGRRKAQVEHLDGLDDGHLLSLFGLPVRCAWPRIPGTRTTPAILSRYLPSARTVSGRSAP